MFLVSAACSPSVDSGNAAVTAASVTTVHSFLAGQASDGAHPRAPLVVGPDGRLYGTTEAGGVSGGGGTVFAIGVDGSYQVLHTFSPLDAGGRNPDGFKPLSTVAFGDDGMLYGVTELGGEGGNPLRPAVGVLYRVSSDGSNFEKLYDFGVAPYAEMVNPIGGLVSDDRGGFWGSTAQNNGSIFHWSNQAGISLLYNFKPRAADGTNYGGNTPYSTPVSGRDGKLYGMDFYGGANGRGVVYDIDPVSPAISDLYDFAPYTFTGNTDNTPLQTLYLAPDGSLWGLTEFGGINGSGLLFRVTGDYVTIVHEFSVFSAQSVPRFSSEDGLLPISTPVMADGWLYFTTFYGGTYGEGSVQRVHADGRGLEQVYSFPPTTVTDGPGSYPYAGLTVGTEGALYGVTFLGSSAGYGAVYRLEVGE